MTVYKKLEIIGGIREEVGDLVLDSIEVLRKLEGILLKVPVKERRKIFFLLKKQAEILKKLDDGPWTQYK